MELYRLLKKLTLTPTYLLYGDVYNTINDTIIYNPTVNKKVVFQILI